MKNLRFKSLLKEDGNANKINDVPLWKLADATLYHGHYITVGNQIITESIHENFNKKWIKSWSKKRGCRFGGPNRDQLLLARNLKTLSIEKYSKKKIIESNSIYLFQYSYDLNFHHFLITALPRLQHFLINPDPLLKIGIKRDTPSYQLEFIESLVPRERWYWIDPQCTYTFKSVWISPFLQWVNKREIVKFYERNFKSSVITENSQSQKLFLSRDDSTAKRPLENATELESLMANKECKKITISKLDLKNRLQTFGTVTTITGVFSAGFANIVLAHNCRKIIFIEHPEYGMPDIYKYICKEKNIDYIVVRPYLTDMIRNLLNKLRLIVLPANNFNKYNSKPWRANIKLLMKHVR